MSKRAVTVSGYGVFFVSLSRQMKNQYIFRVIHIQCPGRFRPDGEREGGRGVVRGGWSGWGCIRLFVCHNCTIAFSEPLVNISELM